MVAANAAGFSVVWTFCISVPPMFGRPQSLYTSAVFAGCQSLFNCLLNFLKDIFGLNSFLAHRHTMGLQLNNLSSFHQEHGGRRNNR
jgi:hypothetical protein